MPKTSIGRPSGAVLNREKATVLLVLDDVKSDNIISQGVVFCYPLVVTAKVFNPSVRPT
jgi:hypothetical protein